MPGMNNGAVREEPQRIDVLATARRDIEQLKLGVSAAIESALRQDIQVQALVRIVTIVIDGQIDSDLKRTALTIAGPIAQEQVQNRLAAVEVLLSPREEELREEPQEEELEAPLPPPGPAPMEDFLDNALGALQRRCRP